jgi:hypothetical protein
MSSYSRKLNKLLWSDVTPFSVYRALTEHHRVLGFGLNSSASILKDMWTLTLKCLDSAEQWLEYFK